MHIAIAGNIGCGKTTLTRMLARSYGWTPFLEPDENPYIADFHKDRERYAYSLQVYLLTRRLRTSDDLLRCNGPVVQDSPVYEDVAIAAHCLNKVGLTSDADLSVFMQLCSNLTANLPRPDLLIYLRARVATLASRIQKRGRSWEQGISIAYLARLNQLYEDWVSSYRGKILVVDTDKCQFQSEPKDYLALTSQIDSRLYGLF